MENNAYLHEVVVTVIVVRDGKFLVTRRSPTKRRFPGMWTVPGGKLEVADYSSREKDSEHYWYNVLETVLRREVKEEVGDIEIDNLRYVTSLATVHGDGAPSLVISMMADYVSGEVVLREEQTDAFDWVTLEEAKKLPLIDGIYDELVMVDNQLKGVKTEWKRFS